jgi:hypothetical protein
VAQPQNQRLTRRGFAFVGAGKNKPLAGSSHALNFAGVDAQSTLSVQYTRNPKVAQRLQL